MIEALLASGLREQGFPEEACQQAVPLMERYAELLLQKNQVMNLTAITEPTEVANLHMLDSTALYSYLPTLDCRVLDFGTGAGFPGIPLKIMCPALSVVLLDAQEKRVRWLSELCNTLHLSGIEAVQGRGEVLSHQPEYREQFDCVTARAVASLPMLCEFCLPFVKTGGTFLAMKSIDSDPELSAAETAVQILGGGKAHCYVYQIPNTKIWRRIIQVQKIKPTPERYPRKFAKMKRQPLP